MQVDPPAGELIVHEVLGQVTDGANVGAAEVRTAVAFKTGAFEPDYHALATESTIVLPWDREVLFEGELVPNPLYRETLGGS